MRRLRGPVVMACCGAFVWITPAQAQFGRGAMDWTTAGNDAQRSSWVRADPKISKTGLEKPGFQLLWKVKVNNDPKQLNALLPAVLLDFYIGYRGFRSLGFVGGSSDNVFAIDTDLGRIEWQKHFSSAAPQTGSTWNCPGGMTTGLTRPTPAAFSTAAGRGGFGGRGGPARSGVGEPGQGAVTLADVPRAPAPVLPPPAPPGAYNPFRRGPSLVYALSSDGFLHAMYVSNGEEPAPPAPFLPANAQARGLIVVDGVAYAATAEGCGGAPNAVWALDLASQQVQSWRSDGGIAGSAGPAFGPDGTLYVATSQGELVFLEPKTLKLKNSYRAAEAGFASSPVVFEYNNKTLLAVADKGGRLHLLGAAAALYKTAVPSSASDFVPGALASWQDLDGARWVLAPTAGAIAAWKVVEQNGAPALQPGWVSRDLVSPLPPMVINGVVFAVSSGEFRPSDSRVTASQRAERSSRAVLYALDGRTGKEMWNSGNAIGSFVHSGGLSAGGSQVYLGAYDGTLYAFGFPMEH